MLIHVHWDSMLWNFVVRLDIKSSIDGCPHVQRSATFCRSLRSWLLVSHLSLRWLQAQFGLYNVHNLVEGAFFFPSGLYPDGKILKTLAD